MNKPAPPKKALHFLRWFCHQEYLEEIEGNLLELYEQQYEESSAKARRQFRWNVLRHFRPTFIKSLTSISFITSDMFKSYFKIAWRSMLKQKLYSFINIGGLSIGLSCFILISLYVQHELSYDRFYDNADQIYRIYQREVGDFYLGTDLFATTVPELAPALMEEFPEVVHAATLRETNALLGYEESNYYEKGFWGDKHFFDVFPYSFVQGNPQTALEKAESIVLTESLAKKIFGNRDPMGQSLTYQNQQDFIVTGIIKDLPTHSSFQFSFISSILSSGTYVREMEQQDWNNNDFHTFFTLAEGTKPLTLQEKLPILQDKYFTRKPRHEHIYMVQSLLNLHLDGSKNFDIGLKGNPKYLSLFSFVAVIVLLLACINYMNLAIARSIRRAREVGLRKVIGAIRWQLIGQFIGESVLITFLGLLLALGLTYFLLPTFTYLLERPIELNFLENKFLLPSLLLLVLVVGISSGSYPAFFMSSLRPVQVLKGKIQGKISGVRLQKWLIIGQYAAAIILVISSFVIYQQFQFIHNKELGYNKEHVVTVSVLDRGIFKHIDVLKNEWFTHPKIISVATTAELPTNVTSGTVIRHINESKEGGFEVYRARIDFDYLDVFDIELLAGRDFSAEFVSDPEESIILNETAAKALGWTPEEAIGKFVKDHKKRTVIGVVKDFHMHSMHMEIAPLMLEMSLDYFAFIAIKVRPDNLEGTLAFLEESLGDYSPYPFEYQFLDEQFDRLYQVDTRLGEIFGFFTLLSIFIASMGLFGLAAFTAEQRTKEIGIRKVLGASISNIVSLLSQDFLKMIFIGFLLAIPVAWYAMHQWLQDFAYRIDIEWWIFALAGIFAIAIALFTISSQSIRAALANPVDSLRNE
ncbi:MAG: ABC transporter permease [Bacteroidota bacterium]